MGRANKEGVEATGWPKNVNKDRDVKSEKGEEEELREGRFFDFIFKADDYFDEKSLEEMEKYEVEAKEELRQEKLGLLVSESLRDMVNILIINHKGKDKLLHMKFYSDDCIHAISECCHNILRDRFKFNQKQLSEIQKKLKPIEGAIRRLAKQSTSINVKRKILQKPQTRE